MDESPIRRNTKRAILYGSPDTPDREELQRREEARQAERRARKKILKKRFLQAEYEKSLPRKPRNWTVRDDTPPGSFYPQPGDDEILAEIIKEYNEKKRRNQELRYKRMFQCVGCAQPAQLACSACLAEFYCSKECQESNKQCNC